MTSQKTSRINDRLRNRRWMAEFLGVSPHTVDVWYCHRRFEDLPPEVSLGRRKMIWESDVIEFAIRHTSATAVDTPI